MEILYIILGWLFGILSPQLVGHISDQYKKKTLQRIIINELLSLKKRLAFIPFLVYPKYGKFDEKIFIWTHTQTKGFKELQLSDDIKKEFEEQIKNKKNLNKFLVNYNLTRKKENPAFNFRKMSTSTIDSNLINFGVLDDKFLAKLLEVKFQINIFNEEIKIISEYLKMTFNSDITNDNHQIIKKEMENKNLFIAERAMLIVKEINNAINLK